MLEITCPFCGPRNEIEFINGGPSRNKLTDYIDELTDSDWVDYLTVAPNPMGSVTEEWGHVMGWEQWFSVRRDTVTHEILANTSKSHA